MYKKNNRFNSILKIFVFIFLFLVTFISLSFSLELTLKGAIDNLRNTLERNNSIQIGGKAILENIYYSSLNQIQSDNFSPILSAISKTTNYLNNKYSCQLLESEIASILYFANSEIKRDFVINLKKFTIPSQQDLGKACNKFSICKFKPDNGVFTNTPTTNQNCQLEVVNTFLPLYTNSIYIENLGSLYKDTALFWNGDINDSTFDIIDDVHMLSKILFHDVNPPAKIPFFNMPTVNYNTIYNSPEVNMAINWFSPYNTYNTINSNAIGGDGVDNANFITNIEQITGYINNNTTINQYTDASIVEFLASTNLNISNPGFSMVGNQCVSGFNFDTYQIFVNKETVTASEYLETIIADINNASCNYDGICQTWEGAGCSDCATSQGPGDFEEIEEFLHNVFPDLNNEIFNVAGSNDEPPSNLPDLSCLQKCEPLPCNPLNCDKLICYAQCLCQEYGTSLDSLGLAGLSSAFKIRFCLLPALGIEPKKSTKVYNIYSIFLELYNVLDSLRNSGEMGLNVKTKEFLDSSKSKRKFSDEISFSVNSSMVSTTQNKSENTMQDEQIQFNNSLMTSILGFGKDMKLDIEKNKYLVMDEPCNYKINLQGFVNSEQKEQVLNDCIVERTTQPEISNDWDLPATLINQQTILVNEEFDTFMRKNSDFWQELRLMLGDLLTLSKVLSQKPSY